MGTKKRPGRVSKDMVVANGFNQSKDYETDAATKRLLQLEKRRLYRRAYRKAKKQKAEGTFPNEDTTDSTGYQLLEDMRWVYSQVGGRRRLEKYIAENPKAFELMLKELIKIEVALLVARIRSKDDPNAKGDQMVFVVLKGLAEEQKILTAMNNASDMRSVAEILAPDGSAYEEPKKEREEDTQKYRH